MYCRRMLPVLSLLAAILLVPALWAWGDEGMWLFGDPPRKVLKERYDFTPTDAWLNHLRQSAVRFPHGSASFVSADGLVMTNHHVGRGVLEEHSTKDRNLMASGYYARTPAEELKAFNMELNVLVSTEDVTAQVNAGVHSTDPAEAAKERRAVMNTMEKDESAKTGLRCEVITLYHGGM